MFRYFISLATIVFLFNPCVGQVPPYINSGDPNFPFPQFLPYENKDEVLGNLGTENAQGVPHAELELRISDAYRHLCNNIAYTGEEVSGVQYMMKIGNGTGFPTPLPARGGDPCTCAEGDGYYLLAAAYMADKITFDGLYMQMHDRTIRRQKRFLDGGINENQGGQVYSTGLSAAGNKISPTEIGNGTLANFDGGSATDGDVDIALALLVAAKQWGETSGIVLNDNGWDNYELSYVEEARKYISALADTIFAEHKSGDLIHGRRYYNVGVIGLDGYFKDGEKQSDVTGWFVNGVSNYKGIEYYDKVGPAGGMYVDYTAPAYAREWSDWFAEEGYCEWCIGQFDRAEASSDWIMGELFDTSPRHIPYGGHVYIDDANNVTFGEGGAGEDARHPWRTLLNYVWHGNPEKTWNPESHEVDINQPNSFERDMGLRLSRFLKNPQGGEWNNECKEIGSSNTGFYGPSTITWDYEVDGTDIGTTFTINWLQGSSSPAAIIGQDYDLMAQMYRQCEIEWDYGTSGDDETGDPKYFHEWFRLLGMLTLSGNLQAPMKMVPASNLKVYRSLDKTFAFTGDIITDTISYRNYGKIDAQDVKVVFELSKEFDIVDASLPYSMSGSDVVFNIGRVEGFTTGNLDRTVGKIVVSYRVKEGASGRYCPVAHIDEGNVRHWTSNEYPNHVTPVMERNCVDIIERSLKIEKSADRDMYNPDDVATFTLNFENSIDAGWLDGGRTGVTFSYAHSGTVSPSIQQNIKLRLWHDAYEPYIDYGNYRIAYYINDPTFNCVEGEPDCVAGWGIAADIYEGGDQNALNVVREPVVPGTDANGSWNQRVSIQFANQLATTTPHLYNYSGMEDRIHRGGTMPLRVSLRMYTSNSVSTDWFDDWSYAPQAEDTDGGLYHPITPDWTDVYNPNQPVDTWHRKMCDKPTTSVDNILIEEWDGYVWRRAFGNGPTSGRDILNVTVSDTLPEGLTFERFVGSGPLGIEPTYNPATRVISWTIPRMLAAEKGEIRYEAKVNFPSGQTCQTLNEIIINKAWISAPTESPFFGEDTIEVTCTPVIVCPVETSMTKSSDKSSYSTGELIQYSIEYTQSNGSISKPEFENNTNWSALVGDKTNANYSASGVSIPQLNNGDLILVDDYSFGENTLGDGIEGTITLTPYSKSALIVRHGGNDYYDGVFIEFEPNNPLTTINVYNGSILLESLSLSITEPSSLDFKITLNGAEMNLWLGRNAADFNDFPNYTVNGILEQTGWFGVARGNTMGGVNGTGGLSRWNAHLDHSFNLSISDIIPSGLIDYQNISGNGVLVDNRITWEISSGKGKSNAIAPGEEYLFTWEGIYDSCGTLTNLAYINAHGLPVDKYGACYDITCTDAVSCSAPSSITFAGDSIVCEGEALSITGATSGTASLDEYYYTWYDEDDNIVAGPATDADELSINVTSITDSGEYILRVEDGNYDDAACYLESSVNLTIEEEPSDLVLLAFPDTAVCPDLNIVVEVSAINANEYEWTINGGTPVINDTSFFSINSGDGTSSVSISVRAINSCGASIIVDTVLQVKESCDECVPPTPFNLQSSNDTLCIGDSVLLETGLQSGFVYTWFSLPDSTVINNTGSELDQSSIYVSSEGLYGLVISSVGYEGDTLCEASDSIRVFEQDRPLVDFNIVGADTTCAGSIELYEISPVDENALDYNWTIPAGAQIISDSSDAGTITVLIDFDNSTGGIITAESVNRCGYGEVDTLDVTISTEVIPTITISQIDTICIGGDTEFGASVTNAGTNYDITWYVDNGVAQSGQDKTFIHTNSQPNQEVHAVLTSDLSCVNTTDRIQSSDTLSVIVDQLAEQAIIVAPSLDTIKTCNDSYDGISAQATTYGRWYVQSSNAVLDSTLNSTNISNLVEGETIDLVWTVGTEYNICPITSDTIRVVRQGGVTEADVAAQSDTFCVSDLAPQLVGNSVNSPNESGSWSSVGSATIDGSGQTNDLEIGINQFVYTISDGLCTPSSDTVTLFVEEEPSQPEFTDGSDKRIADANYQLELQPVNASDTTTWTIVNFTHTSSVPNLSGIALLSATVNDMNDVGGVTDICVETSRESGACPAKQACIVLLRSDGPIAYAGENDTICDSDLGSYVLQGNSLEQDEVASWEVLSTTTATIDYTAGETSATLLTASSGINAFMYRVTDTVTGISKTDTVQLVLITEPSDLNLVPNDFAVTCGDDTLQVEPYYTGQVSSLDWSIDPMLGSFLSANTLGGNTLYTNVVSTEANNFITLTATNKCGVVSEQFPIKVLPTPDPQFTVETNFTVCEGNDVFIELNNIEDEGSSPTYIWTINETQYTSSIPEFSLTGIQESVNVTVELQSDEACFEKIVGGNPTETITIEVVQPTLNINGDNSLCSDDVIGEYSVSGESINLASTDWYAIDENSDTLFLATNSSTVTPSSITDLFFYNRLIAIAEADGCDVMRTSELEVEVIPKPEADVDGRQILCDENDELNLYASGSMGWSGDVQYGWLRNNEDLNTFNSELSVNQDGDYQSIVTNRGQFSSCTDTSEVYNVHQVNYEAIITSANGSFEIEQVNGDSALILFGSPFSDSDLLKLNTLQQNPDYTWATQYIEASGSPFVELINDNSIRVMSGSEFNVIYTAQYGDQCTFTVEELITVSKLVYVPEVFSPNGDGIYDYWQIQNLDKNYPDATVKVFNRWGSMVYDNTGSYEGNEWDGTNSYGNDLPNAVYYFIIELNKANLDPITGNVVIMR